MLAKLLIHLFKITSTYKQNLLKNNLILNNNIN